MAEKHGIKPRDFFRLPPLAFRGAGPIGLRVILPQLPTLLAGKNCGLGKVQRLAHLGKALANVPCLLRGPGLSVLMALNTDYVI